MQVLPEIDALTMSSTAKGWPRVKVCMHSLGTACTDYRLMRNATALLKAGFAVTIVDIEADRSRPAQEEIQGIIIKHIIRPSWFVPTRFKPWFLVKLMVMFIIGFVQLMRTEADIYHAYIEKALPACYLVARLRHKPFVFDAPELPLSEQNVTRWRTLTALSTHLLFIMMRRCAGVIAVSMPIVEEICKRYHLPEVTLIRNVPSYRPVQKSNRLREYLGLSSEKHIALYQGNIQSDRGLDRLVRAAPFLEPNIVLVVMGKGSSILSSQLEALIASEGVTERVKIIPPIPYIELLDWTSSADIGLIVLPPDYSPSIRWCLPNKLFEYLMAGLPVLASQLDAVVEIIKTNDVGQVVFSLSPVDIAQAINTILSDCNALARMRRNALAAAKSEFYWEKESQKLIRLYNSILLQHNKKEEELI